MRFLIALLALAGLFDSWLALRVHNMDPSQAPPCAVTEKFDCGTVNHSRYAVMPPLSFDEDPATTRKVHVPVAMLGLIGYALIGVIALLPRLPFRSFILLQVAEGGVGFAAFLSFLEDYVLQKWCIYCVWSAGIITGIMVLSAIALWMDYRRRPATVVMAL